MVRGGGAVTVTVALLDFEVSATEVATTWYVPAFAGAVYAPEELIVPPPASWTLQVTAVDWPAVVPITVAVNEIVPPVVVDAEAGEIETEMTGGPGVTVTVAVFDFEVSATDFALT